MGAGVSSAAEGKPFDCAQAGGHFYLVAERESANWMRNIQSQPQVEAGSATLNSTPSHAKPGWIPACAGMTPLGHAHRAEKKRTIPRTGQAHG